MKHLNTKVIILLETGYTANTLGLINADFGQCYPKFVLQFRAVLSKSVGVS